MFSQQEYNQSVGFNVGIGVSSASVGPVLLDGEGTCVGLSYLHDIFNSRFRIAPVFRIGRFMNDESNAQNWYRAQSMYINAECDVLRYRFFNTTLFGGGGINMGIGNIDNIGTVGYSYFGYSYGLQFRYEPEQAPFSIILQPVSIFNGFFSGEFSNMMSISLGVELYFK